MSEESARLRIPYIAASQAQKHVTHNEALTLLDTLCQPSVIDKDLNTPPVSPAEGDCYIVAASGAGAWVGWDNRIVRFIDGEWRSYLPGAGDGAGWLAFVQDEEAIYVFTGSAWEPHPPRASTSEVLTGTDASKGVTPDALAALWEKGSNVASAATVSLGEGGFFHITGTTTITDIDFATAKDGRWAWVVFDGALTLTHNATTLVLPGAANIVTATGDRALFIQDASDNVYCAAYIRASGMPVIGLPVSPADNTIVRADGTAGKLQPSGNTIDDSNNIGLNASGSSTGSPRSIAPLNYSTGNAIRFQIGAVSEGWQNAWDQKMQMYCYHGIEIIGARAAGSAPSFVAGSGASDIGLLVRGTNVGSVCFGVKAAASQTAALQQWLDSSGSVLSSVSAAGHMVLRSYAVGTLPSASPAGQLIYVSDGTSNKRLAVSDGTNWRFPDGNTVS